MLPEFDLISGPAQKVLPVQFPGQGQVRKFVLTEQTPAELVVYYRQQKVAEQAALQELEARVGPIDPGEMLAEAVELYLNILAPNIVELLAVPFDGLDPATSEEVRTLTNRQKLEIIERQDELSGLPEALGNGLRLLQIALPRQVADLILPSLESEPTLLDQDTPPTP